MFYCFDISVLIHSALHHFPKVVQHITNACIYLNNIPACTIFIDLVSYTEQQQGS